MSMGLSGTEGQQKHAGGRSLALFSFPSVIRVFGDSCLAALHMDPSCAVSKEPPSWGF